MQETGLRVSVFFCCCFIYLLFYYFFYYFIVLLFFLFFFCFISNHSMQDNDSCATEDIEFLKMHNIMCALFVLSLRV